LFLCGLWRVCVCVCVCLRPLSRVLLLTAQPRTLSPLQRGCPCFEAKRGRVAPIAVEPMGPMDPRARSTCFFFFLSSQFRAPIGPGLVLFKPILCWRACASDFHSAVSITLRGMLLEMLCRTPQCDRSRRQPATRSAHPARAVAAAAAVLPVGFDPGLHLL
jgi:hypothetical protein